MIKLLTQLPKEIVIAFSGGVDSVAITDFLSKKHKVSCAFFHHNTENSERAFEFVYTFCMDRSIPLMVGLLNKEKPKSLSLEEHWRNERYNFLHGFSDSIGPVVTAHHLDDCVETYIWSSLHGKPKVIPNTRKNVIRPFLTTKKTDFVNWCTRKNIEWCTDISNDDVRFTRNYIRKNLIPHAMHVNPGLHKVVKKIIEQKMLVDTLVK